MLWVPIILALAMAAASFRGEGARRRLWSAALGRMGQGPTPAATVIVPVKGPDEGLRENLDALARLDYPDFELIVVSRSWADLPEDAVPATARVVIAGEGDPETAEKIHNLLAAVEAARPESEVFAFADSDGRVEPSWLKALIAALPTEGGAATGFRWHLPSPPDAWSILRSVWNGVAAGGTRFVWGGATAIRRKTFYELNVPAWWKGAVSDDYRLSEALRAAGQPIVFAPGALTPSVDHTGGGEFLGWITRQMRITRFYEPRLWRLALAAHVVYCGAMLCAAWLAAQGSAAGALALAAQLGMGMTKGASRLEMARQALPAYEPWFRRWGWVHVALVPVGTWLWLYGAVAAALSNMLAWRGHRYRLRRLPPIRRSPAV